MLSSQYLFLALKIIFFVKLMVLSLAFRPNYIFFCKKARKLEYIRLEMLLIANILKSSFLAKMTFS